MQPRKKGCPIGPMVLAYGLRGAGADGQGLGLNAFGSLAAKLGIATQFLALPPYLTVARIGEP